MNVKKQANKFNDELLDLMLKQKKLPAEVISFVMAQEMIGLLVASYGDPPRALNALFQIIATAAGEQGYRITFAEGSGPPTMH